MKNVLRILVDMDNTVVDYSTAMAAALQSENPDFPHPIRHDNWSLHTDNHLDLKGAHHRIQSRPHFFLHFKPIPGALEALQEMVSAGHSVFIVSSPSVSNPTCHSDKSKWVCDHLGPEWARRLVLTKDKTIVAGDVLIDDRTDIEGDESSPRWKHVVYAQPYNVGLEGTDERVFLHDWSLWRSTLEKVTRGSVA